MQIKRKSLIVVCVLIVALCATFLLASCDFGENSYQVTFNSQGGSAVTTQTIVSGGVAVKPDDPTREGYTFDGWHKEAECVNAWDFANDKVTANVTVYAKWTPVVVEEKFTMTFNSKGGSAVASQTVTEGGKAIKPTDPTREGYTFGGWFKEAECTTPWDFAVDTVSADTTVYAKWTINQYTVAFDSQGGTEVENKEVTLDYGSAITKPATDPTRTGYTFAGWYTEADGDVAWDFAVMKVTGDTTIYAKWTINSYTVTFNLDGGTGTESVKVDYDNLVTKPANPTKTGYTFVGWFTEANGSTEWDFASMKVTSDTTIYAKWQINNYTVTLSKSLDNAGELSGSGTYEYGKSVTVSVVNYLGYDFLGWFNGEEKLTAETSYTFKVGASDVTYTAKYEVSYYMKPFKFTSDTTNCHITGLVDNHGAMEIIIEPYVTKIDEGVFIGTKNSFTQVLVDEANTHYIGINNVSLVEISTMTLITNAGLNTPMTIPEDVKIIGVSAFEGYSDLAIVIPDSVVKINDRAFAKCDAETLTIGTGVTEIGKRAFMDCWSLTGAIAIPDSVVRIDESAFSGCTSVQTITVGIGVKFIGRGAFDNLLGLDTLTLANPDGWYIVPAEDPGATSGTSVDLSDPSANPSIFKDQYYEYIFKRN